MHYKRRILSPRSGNTKPVKKVKRLAIGTKVFAKEEVFQNIVILQ
jgi:hypothetical protein